MVRSKFGFAAVVALGVVFVAADFSDAQLLRRRARRNSDTRQSFYPPANGMTTGVGANEVALDVRVPTPDAQVMIEGQGTKQTGTMRRFVSPPLTPGKTYTYEIKCTFTQDGQKMTRTETVEVRPGARVTVDLTRASKEPRERMRSREREETKDKE
jgi:uncharacterized protein (TIGR03000 family)